METASQGKIVALAIVIVLLLSFATFWTAVPEESNRISFDIRFEYIGDLHRTTASSAQPTSQQAPVSPTATGRPNVHLSFAGKQSWMIYDKTKALLRASTSKTPMRILFATFSVGYGNINLKDTGWIRVEQYYDAEYDIPYFDSPSYGSGVIVATRYLDGDFLLNGVKYADFEMVRWQQQTTWTQFISGWGHEADVVFMSGDKAGTRRTAVFWIVVDASRKPSECTQYPHACVDVSGEVARGQEFTMEANIKEHWDDWIFYTDSAHTIFGPCDARFTVGAPGHMMCVKHDKTADQAIKWGVHAITEFGYYTTIQGQTTFIQTQTTAAIGTITIVVRTTSNQVVVVQKYTNQTMTNTMTAEQPNVVGFCNNYPDFWLCKWSDLLNWLTDPLSWLQGSTWGIPNWLILLAVVLVLLWIISRLFAPRVQVRG